MRVVDTSCRWPASESAGGSRATTNIAFVATSSLSEDRVMPRKRLTGRIHRGSLRRSLRMWRPAAGCALRSDRPGIVVTRLRPDLRTPRNSSRRAVKKTSHMVPPAQQPGKNVMRAWRSGLMVLSRWRAIDPFALASSIYSPKIGGYQAITRTIVRPERPCMCGTFNLEVHWRSASDYRGASGSNVG
jgi:hypothetical protein